MEYLIGNLFLCLASSSHPRLFIVLFALTECESVTVMEIISFLTILHSVQYPHFLI